MHDRRGMSLRSRIIGFTAAPLRAPGRDLCSSAGQGGRSRCSQTSPQRAAERLFELDLRSSLSPTHEYG